MASASDVVGKSPGRESNKSTRIPSGSFRNSLRSLLPFGGSSSSNKEPPSTPVASAGPPPLSPSRLSLSSQTQVSSPGFGFGFRRDSSLSKGKGRTGSLQLPSHSSKSSLREDSCRKSSLQLKPQFDVSSSSFEPPTLNITSPIRESHSQSVAALSEKPLPGRPDESTQDTPSATDTPGFQPSPSPSVPFELDNTELSTIVEADTSGVSISRYLPPVTTSPSSKSNHTLLRSQRSLNSENLVPPYIPHTLSHASSFAADTSISLSTSGLAAEVRNALGSSTSGEWRTEAPIVDADTSMGFEAEGDELDDVDPTLAALLSPNRNARSINAEKPNLFQDSRLLVQSSLPRIRPNAERRASVSPILTVSSPTVSPRAPSSNSPASSYRRLPDTFYSSSSPTSVSLAEAQAKGPSGRRVFTPLSVERPPSSASRRFYALSARTPGSTRSSLDIPRGDTPSGLSPSPRIHDMRSDENQRFSLDLPPRRQVHDSAQTHTLGDVRNFFEAPQRMRKRSMSVGMEAESSSASARYTYPRNRYPADDRPGSSLSQARSESYQTTNYGSPLASRTDLTSSTPGRLELLGPRTAKAFRAAGLLNTATTPSSHSGADSYASTATPRYRHRSQMSDVTEGLGRSRSVSRAGTSSRLAFSDAGGAPSSSSKHSLSHITPNWNLQGGESPSPTYSSGRAASTAPTSVSASSRREEFFVNERAREAWEEEKDELKTTHATLVQALADTQRTVRILREENQDLRERLDRLEREREKERQAEIHRLKEENARFRREMASSSSSSSRLHPDMYMSVSSSSRRGRGNRRPPSNSFEAEDEEDEPEVIIPTRHRKRSVSNGTSTSSLFVAPPKNMVLLMNEDNDDDVTGASDFSTPMHQTRDRTLMQSSSKRNSTPGRFPFSRSQVPVSPPSNRLSQTNQSYLSSPEVSGVNSSPGSLFLKPEHEVHLGDMEVLELSSGDF